MSALGPSCSLAIRPFATAQRRICVAMSAADTLLLSLIPSRARRLRSNALPFLRAEGSRGRDSHFVSAQTAKFNRCRMLPGLA
jgi:hypothetical protein